jgi:hypothetical protein
MNQFIAVQCPHGGENVDVRIFPAFGIVQGHFGNHALAHEFSLRPPDRELELFLGG